MKAICSGTHVARCHQVIDLGSQFKTFQHNPPRRVREFWLGFEFPTLAKEEGSQYIATVGTKFTYSMGDKAHLRKLLETWRGRAYKPTELDKHSFDKLYHLLGQPVQVTLSSYVSKANNKTGYNIDAVVPLMEGVRVPDAVNKPAFLNLQEEVLDWGTLNDLPKFLRGWVMDSPEYAHHNKPSTASVAQDEYADKDLPF